MNATLSTCSVSPTLSRSPQERILFALDPREREMFLPDTLSSTSPFPARVAQCLWPDALPQKTDTANWRAMLDDIRPDILVSAWHMPPLPADWITGTDNTAPAPLHYICHLTGSVRRQIPRVFIERGGLVTNWGAQAAPQVAEHALLLALASLRQAPQWLPRHAEPRQSNAPVNGIGAIDTRTLFGRRVGIHGCGGVARALASILHPFTPHITCYSEGVSASIIYSSGMKPAATLETLFSCSEILFECEALTTTNRAMINAPLLALLPDGALFVNVARGQLIDESALLAEARTGRLQIALDVMVNEPVQPDSPWREIPGAIYSPHIAGPTLERLPCIASRAMDNITRYLTQKPLTNLVTLDQYDRST
ncbi:hydroxyacid dehydrogenase [Opitutaceae bacterium TAV4]|nr:hydroxyacid dehydrogenase [Opitutaceae bacterium TAV4]RRJ99913.1 hydroxyacid dehydrogenase [Opitutaceae bacterium TAV3]